MISPLQTKITIIIYLENVVAYVNLTPIYKHHYIVTLAALIVMKKKKQDFKFDLFLASKCFSLRITVLAIFSVKLISWMFKHIC